jgi:hypothetical protein
MQKNTSVTLGKYFEEFIAQKYKVDGMHPQVKSFGRV